MCGARREFLLLTGYWRAWWCTYNCTMSADGSDTSWRARPMLSDITNQPAKREFSSISSSQSKYGDKNNKQVCKENEYRSVKRLTLGVENLPVGKPSIIDKENGYSYVKQGPIGFQNQQVQTHSIVEKENDSSFVKHAPLSLENKGVKGHTIVDKEKSSSKEAPIGVGTRLIEALKVVDKGGHDYPSINQIPSGVETIQAETSTVTRCAKTASEVGLCPLKGGKAYRLQSHGNPESLLEDARIGIPKTTPETKQSIVVKGTSISREGDASENTVDLGCNIMSARENCIASLPQAESSQQSKGVGKEADGKDPSEVAQSGSTKEASQVSEDGKRTGGSYLSYSISASVVGPRLTEFQRSKSLELTRCTVLKDDGCSSSNADLDFLKGCSCSFCMKAAYIWSDLHYQDVKGRISASMKSRREASNLVRKIGGKETGRHGQGNSSKCTNNLEADLLNQWKSLFHSMEDIFAKESDQLESSYLALKDMKENCKANLETALGVSIDVPSCSSDPSTDRTDTR
ncbi:hypothetical protein Dimus_015520 [Dionaea muscipula]